MTKYPKNWFKTSRKTPLAVFCLAPLWVLMQPGYAQKTDVGGRLMLDYSRFDGVHNEFEQAEIWYVRRARIGLKHEADQGWEAELEIGFDAEENEFKFTDANIEFPVYGDLSLMVGRMKEGFGLEKAGSSNDIQTLERSVTTYVFTPGRSYGVALEGDHNRFDWHLGLYQAAEDENRNSEYALTGRVVVNPIETDNQLMHLGVSATHRNMAGTEYEINESIEISRGDKVIESPKYDVDVLQTVALEGAWVYKRFSVQSEYFLQNVKEEQIIPSIPAHEAEFDGYYVTLGLFLTDHQRDYKDGSFEGFDTSDDRQGVEIVSRYSQIEIVDEDEGSYAESYLLALNYYLSEDLRLMAEASWTDVESSDAHENGKGEALTLRAIYQF